MTLSVVDRERDDNAVSLVAHAKAGEPTATATLSVVSLVLAVSLGEPRIVRGLPEWVADLPDGAFAEWVRINV